MRLFYLKEDFATPTTTSSKPSQAVHRLDHSTERTTPVMHVTKQKLIVALAGAIAALALVTATANAQQRTTDRQVGDMKGPQRGTCCQQVGTRSVGKMGDLGTPKSARDKVNSRRR